MSDLYPDEIVMSYEVKKRGYFFDLRWEDNHLSFKQFSKNNGDMQEFINPTLEEWDEFWHRMDEIEIWDWYELYKVQCNDSCVEDDEWEVKVGYRDQVVNSHGSNSYPSTFREFVVAVEELIGILIEFIHLV